MRRIENVDRRGRGWLLPGAAALAVVLTLGWMASWDGGEIRGVGRWSLGSTAQAQPPSDPIEVATALSDAFGQVADQVLPAVVSITSERIIRTRGFRGPTGLPDFFERFMNPRGGEPQEFRQQGLGSGVIVRGDGIILTANHVVDGAENVTILLADDREFEAEIVGTDAATDLAVLRVTSDGNLPTAPLSDEPLPRVGEWVVALGNPFGRGLRGTVTAGIVSALGRSNIGLTSYEDFIQTDAAINPGNSGGPLVNLKGEVVGINTAIASRTGGYQGVGFAIPMDLVKPIMESLLEHGRVERGWLGVRIRDLDQSLREAFGMDPEGRGGVLVQEVEDDSPADEAGMEDGDVILTMNDREVEDVQDLRFKVASITPGTEVDFRVLRDGDEKRIEVELGTLESDAGIAGITRQESDDALAALGFDITGLDAELRRELGLDRDISGVVVTEVERFSPAEEAGLRVGDIIFQASRRDVDSPSDLRSIVAELVPDDVLLLRVLTESTRRFVAIRMPED